MNGSLSRAGWKDIAEFIGILAIVASLIFVGLQLWQEHEIANADLQNEMISNRIGLNDQIIANAHILVRANNSESLSPEEQVIMHRLVDSQWAEGFFGFRRWQFVDHPAYLAPMRGFSNFLHENPAARAIWDTMPQHVGAPPGSFQHEFNDLVNTSLAELDSAEDQAREQPMRTGS